MVRWLYLLPVLIAASFALAAFLLLSDRDRDPGRIASPLLDRPAPGFSLPSLFDEGLIDDSLLKGQVSVVNVFASWCAPCRVEHPILMEMAARGTARMIGINYKDEPEAARRWLADLGDPFDAVGIDRQGRAAIDWGVYGIPETFILDADGIIRHKHVGPIMPEDYRTTIRPLIERLAR